MQLLGLLIMLVSVSELLLVRLAPCLCSSVSRVAAPRSFFFGLV